MLSLGLIIILGLLFGLLLCCMVGTVLTSGHVQVTEVEADQPASSQQQTGLRHK